PLHARHRARRGRARRPLVVGAGRGQGVRPPLGGLLPTWWGGPSRSEGEGPEVIHRLFRLLARELGVLLRASGDLNSDHGLWGRGRVSSPLGGEVPRGARGRGR